jgi:hypothetical protein
VLPGIEGFSGELVSTVLTDIKGFSSELVSVVVTVTEGFSGKLEDLVCVALKALQVEGKGRNVMPEEKYFKSFC